ncbi:hypothetical protein V6N12_052793 [Hibiscus sabdariffa]|uniref:Uncharacterized protein n=1 Tax=Hibiscus sabdariffa TaxID=183260 RepID=A0ABR2C2J9_9ROSI
MTYHCCMGTYFSSCLTQPSPVIPTLIGIDLKSPSIISTFTGGFTFHFLLSSILNVPLKAREGSIIG